MNIIYLFPAIFILGGILGLIGSIFRKIKCTELVYGTVVKISYSRKRDGDRTPYPVFGYTYNDYTYTRKSDFSSPFVDLDKGDEVELYIDPDKPRRFYCKKEFIHRIIFDLVLIAIGIVALICIILKNS